MLSAAFGIKLQDEIITNLPVAQKDMLGIQVDQIPLPGMISMYEEHSVRSEAGYTLNEWYNLSYRDRATEIALARINAAVEYQKSKEQERQAKMNSKGNR